MEPWQAALLVLVGFGAAFVQRVSGFGLGIFAMMFLPYLTPSAQAAATVSTLFSTVTSSYNGIKYRKSADFKTLLPMILASVCAIPVAVWLSGYISGDVFTIVLGAVLIVMSVYFIFFGGRIRFKATPAGGVIAGAAGGLLNGLFSTGGPPVVLYLSNVAAEPMAYFATIQFYFAVTNLYAVGVRVASGLVTVQVLLCTVAGLVGCFLGDWVGKKVFDKLNAELLKRIIYVFIIIFLSGFGSVVSSVFLRCVCFKFRESMQKKKYQSVV